MKNTDLLKEIDEKGGTGKSEELFTVHEVEGAPFGIIDSKDQGIFIALGNVRIVAGVFETIEEAEEYIKEKPWELLLNTTQLLIDRNKESK